MQKNSKAKNKGKVVKNKKNKSQKLPMILLIGAIVLIVAGVGGYLLANKGLPGGGFNIMKPQPGDGGCKVQYCTNCKPNNPNYCVTCNSGYTRTSDGQCTKTCSVWKCSKCQNGNPSRCKTCNSGYTLLDGRCYQKITQFKFASGSYEVMINKTTQVVLNIVPAKFTDNKVTYTSSNSSVAKITSTGNGYVVVQGMKAGSATITAKNRSGNSATTRIVVSDSSGVQFGYAEYTVKKGKTLTITTYPYPAKAAGLNANVTCTSSNIKIATVSAYGRQCIVKGIKKGTVTISAKLNDPTCKYASTAKVTVK